MQNRHPARTTADGSDGSDPHQNLIDSFASVMLASGVGVDDLAERLQEAMALGDITDRSSRPQQDTSAPSSGLQSPFQPSQTPRGEFKPDRSIWGPPEGKSSSTVVSRKDIRSRVFNMVNNNTMMASSQPNASINESSRPSSGGQTSTSIEGHATLGTAGPRISPLGKTFADPALFSRSLGHGSSSAAGLSQGLASLHIGSPIGGSTWAARDMTPIQHRAQPPSPLGTDPDRENNPYFEADAPWVSPETRRLPPRLSFPAAIANTTRRSVSDNQTFWPMQAILNSTQGPQRQPHQHTHTRSLDAPPTFNPAPPHPPTTQALTFSDKYYGMHTGVNASADHLPDEQNCALWLRNLPPDITYHELLSSIRNVGRIWCTYINTPDFVTHSTAAAKVVFFAPESASLFLQHINSPPEDAGSTPCPRCIRGFRIKADHNRIKYARHASPPGGTSRVLIVTGQDWFVNEAGLTAWFADKFIFQIDEVIELVKAGGRAVVEFRFGSYRCQSQMGKMALDRIKPPGFEKVEYGNDPCEKGDSLVSYRVAAERIQGVGV